MHRQLAAGALVIDQISVYDPIGTFNRVVGATSGQFVATVFANNELLLWPIVDGSSVLDSEISPGSVYLNEISGAPGFYTLRWFPDRVGFWVFSLVYSINHSESILTYDIGPAMMNASGGLIASFS
jgi:hypothetical protein